MLRPVRRLPSEAGRRFAQGHGTSNLATIYPDMPCNAFAHREGRAIPQEGRDKAGVLHIEGKVKLVKFEQLPRQGILHFIGAFLRTEDGAREPRGWPCS